MKETSIQTGNTRIDALVPRIRDFLRRDVVEYNMFGRPVRGYRSPDTPSIWIRDHSDMLRGAKYWEKDMRSAIDHFAETQTEKGWFFDYFTMTPEKVPCEKENWAKYVRVPVEADVEYRFVKAVYLAWQASGDDRWLKGMLPYMEKALHYILTDDWRWDKKHRLVKRAFTMDTWDFDYTAGRHPWLNFRIDERTFWGIMHGDNSGYYEAFMHMAAFYRHFGNLRRARDWKGLAETLRKRTNIVCFNGRFYTHHVHIVPVKVHGIAEEDQLSLSNPMDINRGLATHDMAVSIIKEYQRRGARNKSFADWFSIDPPFPAGMFGDDKIGPGTYCNGGIMPLVGGELARAALSHGFEKYGVQQLLKYEELTRAHRTFLWYFPDGRESTIETSTSPDASPTDGWGSSAMLYALVEGLAGVEDQHKLYQKVRLSPRWIAAGEGHAEVQCVYGASSAWFAYAFDHDETKKEITITAHGSGTVDLHLLLPEGTKARRVRVGGKTVSHRNALIEESPYVDSAFSVKGKCVVHVEYR